MITLDTLTLDEELVWNDEFEWDSIKMSSYYTVQGKQITTESSILNDSGRYISLGSNNSWISRSDLLILRSWANEPNKIMSLTLNDGRSFTVRFRLWDSPVIDTETLIPEQGILTQDTIYKLNLLKLAVV